MDPLFQSQLGIKRTRDDQIDDYDRINKQFRPDIQQQSFDRDTPPLETYRQRQEIERQSRLLDRFHRVLQASGGGLMTRAVENEYLFQIYQGTFRAKDLLHLQYGRPDDGFSSLTTRTNAPKTFGSFEDFFEAFSNYVHVWIRIFGDEIPDAAAAMRQCVDRLYTWEAMYYSRSIINYALSYLACALLRPSDPAVWHEFLEGEKLVLVVDESKTRQQRGHQT